MSREVVSKSENENGAMLTGEESSRSSRRDSAIAAAEYIGWSDRKKTHSHGYKAKSTLTHAVQW